MNEFIDKFDERDIDPFEGIGQMFAESMANRRGDNLSDAWRRSETLKTSYEELRQKYPNVDLLDQRRKSMVLIQVMFDKLTDYYEKVGVLKKIENSDGTEDLIAWSKDLSDKGLDDEAELNVFMFSQLRMMLLFEEKSIEEIKDQLERDDDLGLDNEIIDVSTCATDQIDLLGDSF